MATFLMFGQYSADSIKKISAKRTANASTVIGELGGEFKGGYATLGKTDLVLIVNFPGVKEAMKASVELTRLLGISFTTAPAITIEEFDKLIEGG